MSFRDLRGEYTQAREAERRELAIYLEKHPAIAEKLCVISSPRAGKGWVRYTSGRRIKDYDLSNWKWVEITDDCDFECIVSLNMPDVDPRSGNSHVLFDRVGLLVSYHKDGLYYETAVYTDIDLPLDEDDKDKPEEEKLNKNKERIAQLVWEQYKNFLREEGGQVT